MKTETIAIQPFKHQSDVINKLDEQFKQNNNKALIVLPSGAGKTHTIAFHVNKIKPKSILYIVHRNEILFQTIKIFKEICKINNKIGIINKNYKDYNKPYLFTTIQTISKKENLNKINENIEYMIIDEYHHSGAETYKRIIQYFKPKYFVGLTATPYRLDKKDILSFIDNNIPVDIDLFDGIKDKILVPFHYIGLHDNINYKEIKYNGFAYNSSDLDRKLIIHKRDEAIINEYKDKIEKDNRLTIGFCNSIRHVERITEKFNMNGIKATGITWHERYEERQKKIQDFKDGCYKVLFARDILNEGVDFPECSAIMFLRPTISKTVFFQQLGRGLRKYKDKKDVLVLDFIGNYIKAFEKRTWFSKAHVMKYTGEYTKPIYEYDYPRPVIEFDEKVIEMMDIEESNYKNTVHPYERFTDNKQELIDNYYKIKEYWTKNKTKSQTKMPLKQLIGNKSISKYGQWAYNKQYGNLTNFLSEINKIPIINHKILRTDSTDIIIKKMNIKAKELQKKLGREFFTYSDWTKEYGEEGLRRLSIFGGFIGFKKAFNYPLKWKKVCDVCNKAIYTRYSPNRGKSYTCSTKCRNIYHHKYEKEARKRLLPLKLKIIINCKKCNKEFNKHEMGSGYRLKSRKFCSDKCRANYYNTKRRMKLKEMRRLKRLESEVR